MQKNPIRILTSLCLLIAAVACNSPDGSTSSDLTGSGGNNGAGNPNLGSTPTSQTCAQMTAGISTDLNGFIPFPADNPWNTRVDNLAADPNSTSLISGYNSRSGKNPYLQGDLGDGYGEPYNVVDSSTQPTQMVSVTGYPDESDIMPVPLPNSAGVEGGKPCPSGNDCHMFILDKNKCWLYETWLTNYSGGKWSASNMAVWDMLDTNQRPYGWTSADAAGLPVFPGLVRYDEVARGEINHAIRFTLARSADSFVPPASHSAGSNTTDFPMGQRFRLKANFDVSGYSSVDQVILTAMKKYGIILADNGLDLEFAGAVDSRWQTSDVLALRNVHFTDFEVLPAGTATVRTALPKGSNPTIASLNASATSVQSGAPVTLSWETSNDSWDFIDVIGPVRGNSVTVTPTATTTYTLKATNAYGRTSKSITVQVLH